MTLQDQLQADMRSAMKRGDADALSTLRMLVSAVHYAAIDAKDGMHDDAVIAVLRIEAKKRREAMAAYTQAGQAERAEAEQRELAVIESYLPAMMDEEAVRERVAKVLDGAPYPSFGAAMGASMRELAGKADGDLVARVVKELYEA